VHKIPGSREVGRHRGTHATEPDKADLAERQAIGRSTDACVNLTSLARCDATLLDLRG
jgi:hypothetical protein